MRRISPEALAQELKKREIPGWNWSKNGGGYHQKHDFFTVHWEVQIDDPTGIRLHVESPTCSVDPFLNELKQEVISAILASDIPGVVQRNGFQYMQGRRVSTSALRNYRSTEPFCVVLTAAQRNPKIEQDITMVHEAIGPHVHKVVQQFSERLNQHFGS